MEMVVKAKPKNVTRGVRSSIDGLAPLGVARCPASTVGWGERGGRYLIRVTQFPSTPTYVEVVAFSKRGETISSLTTYDEFVVDDIIDGGRLDMQVD
jgi:hypothetical protein